MSNVAEADITTASDKLFDRGYGFVYLNSASDDFSAPSEHTAQVLQAVGNKAARRLSGFLAGQRRLQTATYQWSCDDTLFECAPICLRTMGLTSTKVLDRQCAGEPLDMCACGCFYNAAWTCEDGNLVCKATSKLERATVGDVVCSSRGGEKPTTCEDKSVERGSYPTGQCLAQYEAEKLAVAEARAAADATPSPEVITLEESSSPAPVEILDSGAAFPIVALFLGVIAA